jgi:hypothetical protein
VVLDIDWPVATLAGMDKKVGLAYATAADVWWQSAPQDQGDRLSNGFQGRRLQRGGAYACRYAGITVALQNVGDQTQFELSSSFKAALKYWGYRHWHRWNDRVVLCSNGALLCEVPAL